MITVNHKGRSFTVVHEAEDGWPVTSVRLSLRVPLPQGVAIHPAGTAPWSAGRIGSQTFQTGDSEFDRVFSARADARSDLRVLESPEIRRLLVAAAGQHPGLWIGHEAVVVAERGHVRGGERLESVLDEIATIAAVIEATAAGTKAVKAAKAKTRGERGAETAPRVSKSADAAAAGSRQAGEAGGAAAGPAAMEQFVRACFDRSVAAYEVNRRLAREWLGRRIVGEGSVAAVARLEGHDFDFGDLKGVKIELRAAGPDETVSVVRVQLQVDDGAAPAVAGIRSGHAVRFDGRLASANPLLHTIQIVSASVTPA